MFFFSSRRRHTRYWRDWSSDVCSSDLSGTLKESERIATVAKRPGVALGALLAAVGAAGAVPPEAVLAAEIEIKYDRSEERRVGKEGRKWVARDDERQMWGIDKNTQR